MTVLDQRHDAAAIEQDRCARCLTRFEDGVDRHDLQPEEAAEWQARPGLYHEGCCPECNGPADPLTAYPSFRAAARDVLAHLHERLGFDLWTVSRVAGGELVVVVAEDHGYGVREGSSLRWCDSFCSRMVARYGPRVAPDSDRVWAYANAPVRRTLTVGAYIGVPLQAPDGALLGILCAIHPTAVPSSVRNEQSLVELQARLLSSLLVDEIGASPRALARRPVHSGDE